MHSYAPYSLLWAKPNADWVCVLSASFQFEDGWWHIYRPVGYFLWWNQPAINRSWSPIWNQQYTPYILERLELCTHVCRIFRERIASIDGDKTLTSYVHSLDELLECLCTIRNKWFEYKDLLDSDLAYSGVAYHVPVVHMGQRGRPRFEVTRGQVEYLASLSFTWSEIATLFGVSRTTLYR